MELRTAGRRVYIGKLAGTSVFDPIGDQVGKIHDVVVIFRYGSAANVIGFVVEVKDVKDEKRLDTACATALKQIEDKNYIAVLNRYRVKELRIYGIAFCDKECRVVVKRMG